MDANEIYKKDKINMAEMAFLLGTDVTNVHKKVRTGKIVGKLIPGIHRAKGYEINIEEARRYILKRRSELMADLNRLKLPDYSDEIS